MSEYRPGPQIAEGQRHMSKHVWEAVAELLDDPLPADWAQPDAIAARQGHLAGLAYLTADAAHEAAQAFAQARQRGMPFTPDTPAVRRAGTEVVALVQALRRYVHDTQRDDGWHIIGDVLRDVAGETLGALVADVLDCTMETMTEPEPGLV